jgi:inner membrane protein
MASVFGHGITAYTIAKVASHKIPKALIILAILSSILPDADVIGFKLGIPYEAPFGHRGFSHSILFASIWALIIMFVFGKLHKQLYFFVIFFSTISHGILDAITTGGRGIGFFIPFVNERYFFPWQVLKVSPLGIVEFFSEWGFNVILSEIKYVLLPCVIVLFFILLNRRN